MRRLPSLAPILLLAAAFALPGSAAASQQLAYGPLSPAPATYTVADNTTMSVESPFGPIEIAAEASLIYTLVFTFEGGRTLVSGQLNEFEAKMDNPMAGGTLTMSAEEAGVSSNFELVLGRGGVAEVVAGSRQAGGELPMLVDPHDVIFPGLPAGDADTGDTWVDTVTSAVGDGGERIVVYTYTLEGEAAHDGRPHLRVAVSGETTMTMGPMSLSGSETGHYLWDVERGLMSSSEISRSESGSMTTPDGAQAAMEFTATTRLTLEN